MFCGDNLIKSLNFLHAIDHKFTNPPAHLLSLQRSEQYFTSSQDFPHFFLQLKNFKQVKHCF